MIDVCFYMDWLTAFHTKILDAYSVSTVIESLCNELHFLLKVERHNLWVYIVGAAEATGLTVYTRNIPAVASGRTQEELIAVICAATLYLIPSCRWS
jgi:hypothetical protein